MLAPEYILPPKKPEPKVFTMTEPAERATAKSSPKSKSQTKAAKPATPAPPTEVKDPPPLAMVMLDSKTFASTNIGALPQAAAAAAPDGDGGAPGGKGSGPNGERLYNAEWYREPTEAETAPYFRGVRSSGWGEIACRTVERWHVEDCREIDESPAGAGIARAARQASWQFLVRAAPCWREAADRQLGAHPLHAHDHQAVRPAAIIARCKRPVPVRATSPLLGDWRRKTAQTETLSPRSRHGSDMRMSYGPSTAEGGCRWISHANNGPDWARPSTSMSI